MRCHLWEYLLLWIYCHDWLYIYILCIIYTNAKDSFNVFFFVQFYILIVDGHWKYEDETNDTITEKTITSTLTVSLGRWHPLPFWRPFHLIFLPFPLILHSEKDKIIRNKGEKGGFNSLISRALFFLCYKPKTIFKINTAGENRVLSGVQSKLCRGIVRVRVKLKLRLRHDSKTTIEDLKNATYF